MSQLTYAQSVIMGALQGISELFPISSLGHSVLIPALVGTSWANLNMTADKSPYLAFLVAMHVATALALLIYFWRDWVRVIGGLVSMIRERRIQTPDQRLAALLIVGTIPVGIAGIVLDHALRSKLGTPKPTAVFLMLNGVVLGVAELLRRRSQREPQVVPVAYPTPVAVGPPPGYGEAPPRTRHRRDGVPAPRGQAGRSAGHAGTGPSGPGHGGEEDSDTRLSRLSWTNALIIGASQSLGLVPGFSRSGATMSAGLMRGLSNEDAIRLAFLLATPAILGAGVYKVPELLGPEGQGIHGQVILGSLVAGVCAYISARFLTKYFETRTLTPFAIYCVVAGAACLAYFI